MRCMHEYLATVPFDLYELHLFHLVAKHGSFTKAAETAGLTQSAITRQIQGMESSLGLSLLERTTRSVRLTEAGKFLAGESARLLGDVERSLQTLRVEFAGAKRQVRVGVSRSVALAYMPGFFHANLKRLPEVACRITAISYVFVGAAPLWTVTSTKLTPTFRPMPPEEYPELTGVPFTRMAPSPQAVTVT